MVMAQKNYFVYLQTDDQAAFYIRMADKVFSSTASGYLILPNLSDTTYSINFGLAKSSQPETQFSFAVNNIDHGFLIKKFPDGLSMFDLQTLSLIKAINFNGLDKDAVAFESKTDRFTTVLSKAADDPALLKSPAGKKLQENKASESEVAKSIPTAVLNTNTYFDSTSKTKADSVRSVVSAESPLQHPDTGNLKPSATLSTKVDESSAVNTSLSSGETTVPKANDTISKKANGGIAAGYPIKTPVDSMEMLVNFKPSAVKRYSESSTTEGFGLVYLDRQSEEQTDTIRVLIVPSRTAFNTPSTQAPNASDAEDSLHAIVHKTTQTDTALNVTKPASLQNPGKTNCVGVASDKDFLKLRKNMASQSSDEDMISEARKSFKARCFTTEQVRYLSSLFLTSGGKYNFFDAAYTHVVDVSNFQILELEIKDEYFKKRFKALIGE